MFVCACGNDVLCHIHIRYMPDCIIIINIIITTIIIILIIIIIIITTIIILIVSLCLVSCLFL